MKKYVFLGIIVATIIALRIFPFFFCSWRGVFFLPLPFEYKISDTQEGYVWVDNLNVDDLRLLPDELFPEQIEGPAHVKRIGWNSDVAIIEVVPDGGRTQWIAIGRYGEEITYFTNETDCVALLEKQKITLLSPEDALYRRELELGIRLTEYNAMKISESQSRLRSIATSLCMYFFEKRSYPIRLTDCVPDRSDRKDSWGTPINYKFPGNRYPEDFDLWSSGPDKISGTPDDIWKAPMLSPVKKAEI